MYVKSIFFLFLVVGPFILKSQQVVTLQQCHQAVDSGFPLVANKIYQEQIMELKQKNLTANYLPGIELNGKYTWQNKVTEIKMEIPQAGISIDRSGPKDQYSATFDVNQVLYDGGTTKAGKKVVQASTDAELAKTEVDIYDVKTQVNQLYFNILLLQESRKTLDLMHETISERRKVLVSAIDNGMINASELDNLDVELLDLESQMIEIESNRIQLFYALNQLCQLNFKPNAQLVLPELGLLADSSAYTPEHIMFEKQLDLVDANIKLTGTKLMPKLFAFASAGGGNPGLDMFSSGFDTYYIVGAKLNWKIWDWRQTRREKEQLQIQKQMIESSREIYNRSINTKLNETRLRNRQNLDLIQKDNEIIALRKKIADRTGQQLAQGIKTSADYIADLNAEKKARIELNYREIELIRSEVDYRFAAGKSAFAEK
jgi:outer membrane protein TolC